ADHLLRMAVLGPANVAFLDRARPARVGDDCFIIHAEVGEDLTNALAVSIGADDTGEHHPGAQGAEHGGAATGAAKSLLALVGAEEDDRRFLANALGVAPHVAIEHQVAHDQHAWLAKVLHEVNEYRGHRPTSERCTQAAAGVTTGLSAGAVL